MKQLVILGAGTGGTIMANKLAKVLSPRSWAITVVDKDNQHVYQPGLLFVPFGTYRPDEIVKKREPLLASNVALVLKPVAAVEADINTVVFEDGERLRYDLLIVATGTRIVPEATPGLTGVGWQKDIFDFYTLEGASALAPRLDGFEKGRVVVNVADMPIKCPVAPLEFVFLADAFFTERGVRDQIELVYATPLDGAFTKPVAAALLGDLLASRNILVEPNFGIEQVDSERRTVSAYDGRVLDYDLLVTVPTHAGSELIASSGLGDDDGFIPTNPYSLQTKAHSNVFALGDATDLPTSKAGSVAHFQADVLFENVLRYIDGLAPLELFDGHANCFIETGYGKAMLIDFNYKTEPLPGRFPLPGIGPFTLLEESAVNHWGKLGFKWVYWNLMMRGEELPLDHRMVMAGKWA